MTDAPWLVFIGYGAGATPDTLMVQRTDGAHFTERDARNIAALLNREAQPIPVAGYHAPTDTPIGAIPTPAGRQLVDDYRAHRTRQQPTGDTR